MRPARLVLFAGSIALAATLSAQPGPAEKPVGNAAHGDIAASKNPFIELSLGYAYMHANAPPGSCQCFSLNGGFASAAVNLKHGFSLAGDLSVSHAGNIAGSTQTITVVNYLFGPRYSWRPASGRFTPYGQFLLGGSTELSSSPPVQHVSAFAFETGGGVNARLTHRFGWNIVELDWLHSQLPNAVNNRQNDLKITSGVIFRF
jgi:hypothetical protein